MAMGLVSRGARGTVLERVVRSFLIGIPKLGAIERMQFVCDRVTKHCCMCSGVFFPVGVPFRCQGLS